MSTIMGIKTNNIVILGADKQLSTYDNEFISDNSDKILSINNHLAIACAGNAAIQKAIEIDIEKMDVEKIIAEDVVEVIYKLFEKLKKVKVKTILSVPSYVIIGGLDKNKNLSLKLFSYKQGKIQCSEVAANMVIVPPNDVSEKKCIDIFVENYRFYTSTMIEKTVSDISDISSVVSKSGNKWVYDNRTKLSKKEKF